MSKLFFPRLAVPASLGVLWYFLLRDLSLEWNANPQYQYAWAVPFLCACLAWHVWAGSSAAPGGSLGTAPLPARLSTAAMTFIAALAALWLPVRLVGEANPDWRIVMWAMALITVGITVLLLGIVSPPFRVRSRPMLFAVCFFLVAVPWPGMVETPIVGLLTRQNTLATVEVLSILGIPAMAQGSQIELSTGFVGIEEACSGIRSLQANLMIALFLGEFFRLRVRHRLVLLGLGLVLTMLFNLLRTVLLSYLAATAGIAAADSWHGTTGVAILVLCFSSLSAAARLFRRNPGDLHVDSGAGVWPPCSPLRGSTPCACGLVLLGWVLISESAVQGWYAWNERVLGAPVTWRFAIPPELPELREVKFAESEIRMLRFDQSSNLRWREGHLNWQAVFLEWNPGRISAMAARGHTPEGCLPGSGKQLVQSAEERTIDARGLNLPARILKFRDAQLPLHVLYCVWEDRAGQRSNIRHHQLTRSARIAAALAGQRNLGQRSLELAVWGIDDSEEAATLLETRCKDWIKLTTPN